MKVLIDTNVWISCLINKEEKAFVEKLKRRDIEVIISRESLKEILLIAARKKFANLFTSRQISSLIRSLIKIAVVQKDVPHQAQFQDPKDEFLLDLSTAGDVDFLVTGDKALLELGQYHQTKIISLAEFKALLSNERQL